MSRIIFFGHEDNSMNDTDKNNSEFGVKKKFKKQFVGLEGEWMFNV